jgi:hypothetical protein
MVTFITIRLSHAEISAVFTLGFISELFSTNCWVLDVNVKVQLSCPEREKLVTLNSLQIMYANHDQQAQKQTRPLLTFSCKFLFMTIFLICPLSLNRYKLRYFWGQVT